MMIKEWISEIPRNANRRIFQKKLGLSEEYTNKINNIIGEIEKNKELVRIVDELYESFKELIQK